MIKSIITTCLLAFAAAFYHDGGPVVKLNSKNWKEEVMKSDSLWLIEFYAPWCGHCQKLTPSWEKVARQLKGVVKVGAVDMTTDEEVGRPYDIKGFPSLKWFGFDKSKPIAYEQARETDDIRNFALT